jgi:DNA-binding NtrC family response regulator
MLLPMESSKDRSQDKRPLLSVVDDDESVRESLPDLLREFGFAGQAFSSAEEFLSSGCLDKTSCLILDIAMPAMNGPELQQEMKGRGKEIPINIHHWAERRSDSCSSTQTGGGWVSAQTAR